MGIETLFDQVKNVWIQGPRLSGEPEVLHEIEGYFRSYLPYAITRDQIKLILESVPMPLPWGWKSPKAYADLNSAERELYAKIEHCGVYACPGPIIEKVIELGTALRPKGTGQAS